MRFGLNTTLKRYFPGMQKGNLDSVKSDAHGRIKKETVALQGVSVTRVTFDVGANWSNDLKDYAGTDSCKLPHVALVLSGTLRGRLLPLAPVPPVVVAGPAGIG